MKSKLVEAVWQSLIEKPLLLKTFLAGLVVLFTSKVAYHTFSARRILPSSDSQCGNCSCKEKTPQKKKLRILCGSGNGRSEKLSKKCFDLLHTDSQISSLFDVEWLPIQKYDPEDEIINDAKLGSHLIIFMPTYLNEDLFSPNDSKWFCKWISEASSDFRFSSDELKQLKFTIFGIGDSAYGTEFCILARNLNDWLCKLKAERFYGTCLLDTSSDLSPEKQFSTWFDQLSPRLVSSATKDSCTDGSDVQIEEEPIDQGLEQEEYEEETEQIGNTVTDLEDIVKPNRKVGTQTVPTKEKALKKDMLTPALRAELTKQGYKLIGSHSGVKLCRWTKSMLRGRGLTDYQNWHQHWLILFFSQVDAIRIRSTALKVIVAWRQPQV